MSHIITPLIDCPNLQLQLNDITDKGMNPNEPAPELQFLVSPVNTKRVLETNVSPGGGKVRTVEVVYTQRLTESEIDTTLTTDCEGGIKAGMLSTTYTVDELTGVQYQGEIEIADLTRICQSNPEYYAKFVANVIDGVKRKMQKSIADQMVLLAGKFASDNGETGLSAGNTLKTVKTKYAAAIDGGKWNPEALQEIVFSAMNSGFTGTPYAFGFGEIWRYWNYLGALGNFSDGGLDFAKYVGNNQAAFLASQKMHKALNPSSGNKFLVVDANSLFLLQYNRFDDQLAKVSDTWLIQDVIVDPLTGVAFNYKVYKNPCGEKITVTVSTAFKVVGLPDDMYAADDRLAETNGVLTFQITNT